MFDIQRKSASLTIGRKIDSITGVIIHTGLDNGGEEITYSAGNSTGYVIEIECPIGTQAIANNMLSSLKLRGYQYQPFAARDAIIDPACEMGDNITANGVRSIIFSRGTEHTRLMLSSVSAPYDEEVDHEFSYVPRQQREFKRESAYARSRIAQTENEISLEVSRATDAENVLESRLVLAENNITAEVTRATDAESSLSGRLSITEAGITAKVSKTGGSASSFGWSLTDSSHIWSANGQEVMKITASGLKVKGEIEADSGTIGDCLIVNGVLKITNANIDNINATKITAGYLSVDRIESASLTGSKIAASTITGGSGGNLASLTVSTLNTVSGINTNLGYAAGYGSAIVNGSSVYPSVFNCGTLFAYNGISVIGSGGAGFSTDVTIRASHTLSITGNSTLDLVSGTSSFTAWGYGVSWKSLRYVSDIIGGVPEYATVYYLGR